MASDVTVATQLIRVAAYDPEAEFEIFLARNSPENAGEILLAVDFEFCEYWREEKTNVDLTALFYWQKNSESASITVLRVDDFNICEKAWREHSSEISDLVHRLPVSVFPLDGVMPLQPIAIPKPWGQEIWYTGIEARGVAEIGEAGRSVPLPWLLAVAPRRLLGGAVQQPILLKILDPLPEPVFGDLYFELHREKQEVYVVTAVDRHAWPDGRGAIRFGFNTKRRGEYASDSAFVDAYLLAVRDYRVVRKQIDAQIDKLRMRDGIELNTPVTATTLQKWMTEIDSEMQSSESILRQRMESFTALQPLGVGDVVKVPCLLPHSLQHGVRTVEFQTPVYERLILSFAQKVLTQADWDIDEAATILQIESKPDAAFPVLARGEGWVEEQIVAFDDFEVRRISLEARTSMRLELGCEYGLGMVVGQPLVVDGSGFNPDDAILLPAELSAVSVRNSSDEAAYFLLALPLRRVVMAA